MIEFTLNNDTYYLPQDWSEVKYDQFAKYSALLSEEGVSEEGMSGTDYAVKIVSILTGVPLETLEDAPFEEVTPLFERLDFLQVAPEPVSTEFVTVFGVNYYAQSIEKVGELAAFDKINQAFSDDDPEKLPYILAILLRKRAESTEKQSVTGSNDDENDVQITFEPFVNDMNWIEKRAKMFANALSPAQVMGLAAFFLTNGELLRTLTRYSSPKHELLREMKALSIAISAKNTGGWRLSTIWNRMCSIIVRGYIWTLERS